METQLYDRYPAKLRIVLILPMRNGNYQPRKVPIGNISSYPTYEEWKLFLTDLSAEPE